MFIVHPYTHASAPYSSGFNNVREKQGKVAELKLELNGQGGKKDKNNMQKKIALKKIVANMTMSNNDMVALFADIVGCMGIQNLEIKKMWVYKSWVVESDGQADEPAGASCIWSTTLA